MHACKEQTSNLCSWCSNNRWVGPETERIPQPVPDPNNREHFMDVFRTESTGRTPDDYLPRKCLKDLHEEHSGSVINDGDTIKSFCSKYNVGEKHVITYINHLKVIDIRKDIWTREADERKRQEAEPTYKDLQGLQLGRQPYWKWQDRKGKGKRTWLLPERTRTDHYW